MPDALNLVFAIASSTVLTGAVVFVIVKSLLKPIWTTLNSYAAAYANGQATIDVRIRNVEHLVEETRRITEAAEKIKSDDLREQRLLLRRISPMPVWREPSRVPQL